MRIFFSLPLVLVLFISQLSSVGQNFDVKAMEESGEYLIRGNDANNPEFTLQQYEMMEKRCNENIKRLGLDKIEKSKVAVLLMWPVKAAANLTDCSFYGVSAYVDQNTSTGVIADFNCGSSTYDGHHGTDIYIWPFSFYKMDNSMVEVIAAAAGTIIDKTDGNFDRNCSSGSNSANYIFIQHSDGTRALYGHMKSGSVNSKAIGQTVVAGEYLGVVGSSGNSSGPHLHFEVWSGSTNTTYKDPFSGTCNTLNANSWWISQKSYREPAVLKASVHTTDIVFPSCPTTETLNESSSFPIPFQGAGLPAGYAKFYIFLRDATVSSNVDLKILNPNGTVFSSWTYNVSTFYKSSYGGWSKKLPTIAGTYTFQVNYNSVSCSQTFRVGSATGITPTDEDGQLQLFPNPTNSKITIVCEKIENSSYQLELRDIIGKIVFTEKGLVENGILNRTFSISELPNGIYFMTLVHGNIRTVRKMVKQTR